MIFLYIILAILAAAAVWGYLQGFIQQIGSVAGLLAAVVVCRVFGSKVAAYVCADIAPGTDTTFITILSYIALGLVAYFGAWIVVRMVRGLVHGLKAGIIDKIAGAAYKALLWAVMISLAYNLYICVAPHSAPVSDAKEDVWKRRVLDFAPTIFGSESARAIFDEMHDAITGD